MTCLLGNLLIHAASPHIFAYEEKEGIGFHFACLVVNDEAFFLWFIFQVLESVLGISIILLLKETQACEHGTCGTEVLWEPDSLSHDNSFLKFLDFFLVIKLEALDTILILCWFGFSMAL